MRNKGDGAEEKRLVSKQIVSEVGDCNTAFARFCSISCQIIDHSLMAYLRCVLHVGIRSLELSVQNSMRLLG